MSRRFVLLNRVISPLHIFCLYLRPRSCLWSPMIFRIPCNQVESFLTMDKSSGTAWNGYAVASALWVVVAIAALAVCLRFWSRRLQGMPAALNDHILIVAWVMSIALPKMSQTNTFQLFGVGEVIYGTYGIRSFLCLLETRPYSRMIRFRCRHYDYTT